MNEMNSLPNFGLKCRFPVFFSLTTRLEQIVNENLWEILSGETEFYKIKLKFDIFKRLTTCRQI
jgi:hypothetical protein